MLINRHYIVKQDDYNKSMSTIKLDVHEQCSHMVMLLNGKPMFFDSTKEIQRYVEKMKLRITGTSVQGTTYLVIAQREDSSL
jgi:hypothetical protein